jgi:hypothetical protein
MPGRFFQSEALWCGISLFQTKRFIVNRKTNRACTNKRGVMRYFKDKAQNTSAKFFKAAKP